MNPNIRRLYTAMFVFIAVVLSYGCSLLGKDILFSVGSVESEVGMPDKSGKTPSGQ